MNYQQLQGLIGKFLINYKTSEGKSLIGILTRPEVYELSVAISNNMVEYPEMIVQQVQDNVFEVFHEEELETYLVKNIKKLLSSFITNTLTEEQYSLLIFLLISHYQKSKYSNLSENLKKIREYYYSHIINDQETLIEEVKSNININGQTREYNDYVIRINSEELDFIPTKETLDKFKEFIINLK